MKEFFVTHLTATRLDAFLLAQCPQLTPGNLHKYLRENKIKVNGKKIPLSTRLQAKDNVKLFVNFTVPQGPLFLQAKPLLQPVYETDEVLIVDKPAGLPVVAEDDRTPDTLLHRALLYLYNKGTYTVGNGFTPCLCHRLDTGTSGLVILAKTPQALETITQMLRDHSIKKEYHCVTFGHPPKSKDSLKAFLEKDSALGKVRISEKATAGGKPIETKYTVLAKSGCLALLEVTLVTGRTHQIRAHMAFLGCPLLGDSKYGDNAVNRARKLKYQALCAYRLTFPAINDSVCADLSNKVLTAACPWYETQVLDGSLR